MSYQTPDQSTRVLELIQRNGQEQQGNTYPSRVEHLNTIFAVYAATLTM